MRHHWTVLLPALAICAASAAGPAWADGGIMLPVPGAESAVPEAGALAKTGPATTAGSRTADAPSASTETAAPPGGSRLLKALSATGAPERALSQASAPVFAAEGCPRALLRRLLAGAAGEADALSALAIEQEVLVLCRERQEIVTGLFETEARLRELQPQAPVTALPAATPAPPAAPAAEPPAGHAVSPLRAALASTGEKTDEADPRAEDTRAEDSRAGDARAPEPQAPRYAWFSIIGTAGALRAGVTDGAQMWFVREGDPLPGGATVAVISGRPPGVRIAGAEGAGGEEAPLPYRARPGGGP